MATLNYKHLRYFWMVAKTGSIARAAEQLHLTPQSISGQLSEFDETLGVALFRRAGRNLELTDAGRLAAQEIPGILCTVQNSLLAGFTVEEWQTFKSYLRRMLDTAQALQASGEKNDE